MATVPRATEVYYHLSENPLPQIGPEMLKKAGKSTVFYVDGEQIISSGIDLTEETDYYLYMVAKVGSGYSKMYAFEFSTGTFDYSQLATVVATLPDGYKIHLKMPESVKNVPGGQDLQAL
jgi:hypothetical protein